LVGGSLEVQRVATGVVVVTCLFPISPPINVEKVIREVKT
jgi:hypothetical protein